MKHTRHWLGLLVLIGTVVPAQARAQWLEHAVNQDTAAAVRYPVARIGKWITLAGAAGAATYGVLANAESDRRYADLERVCQSEPPRCAQTANGAFTDAGLEREYQEILKLDDRARLALIAGQVSVIASVALFIIDLPRGRSGEGIPYTPPRLQIGYDAGARLQISYRLR